jgi:hypothetical protein
MNSLVFDELGKVARLGLTLEACYKIYLDAVVTHDINIFMDGNTDIEKRASLIVSLNLETSDLTNVILRLRVKSISKTLKSTEMDYVVNKVRSILANPFYSRSKNRPMASYRKWLSEFDNLYRQEDRKISFAVTGDLIEIKCGLTFNISQFILALRTFGPLTYGPNDKYTPRIVSLMRNYERYPYSPDIELCKLLLDQSKSLGFYHYSDTKLNVNGFECAFNGSNESYRLIVLGPTEDLKSLWLAKNCTVRGSKRGIGSLIVPVNIGRDEDPFKPFALMMNKLKL